MKGASQAGRLGLVLAINVAMVAGLLAVGLVAHSLGVLAWGADYLGRRDRRCDQRRDHPGDPRHLLARLARHRAGRGYHALHLMRRARTGLREPCQGSKPL